MNTDEEEIDDDQNKTGDNTDFILDFLERKKLQNRILGEIIERIKNAEEVNESNQSPKNQQKS